MTGFGTFLVQFLRYLCDYDGFRSFFACIFVFGCFALIRRLTRSRFAERVAEKE